MRSNGGADICLGGGAHKWLNGIDQFVQAFDAAGFIGPVSLSGRIRTAFMTGRVMADPRVICNPMRSGVMAGVGGGFAGVGRILS